METTERSVEERLRLADVRIELLMRMQDTPVGVLRQPTKPRRKETAWAFGRRRFPPRKPGGTADGQATRDRSVVGPLRPGASAGESSW